MIDLDQIELEILKKYPKTSKVKDRNYNLRIPIKDDVYLTLNFKNYPKIPKLYLLRDDGRTFNLSNILSTLRDWDKRQPPSILDLIQEIQLLIDDITSNQIQIKKELIYGLMEMCRSHHPQKVIGILRVEKGVVSEYILPSRACTDLNKNRDIWGTSSCAIPMNISYQGTFISRPKGDLLKNEKLLEIFKKRRFTLLIAYPYSNPSCFKCFDTKGNPIELSIVD